MSIDSSELCPCGSAKARSVCCETYLTGTALAPSAEALMRARYTAFALGNERYIRASWHPDTCPASIVLMPDQQWIGLRIVRTELGSRADSTGVVEYIAISRRNGRAHRLHETSRFNRVNGHWLYFDGEVHPRNSNRAPKHKTPP